MSKASAAARTFPETGREETRGPGAGPWGVLSVDDEPELHEVTRMLLSEVSYQGAPLDIHSAASASEAVKILHEHANIALVLLDVVMETDDAGLRLVGYIRQEMRNDEIQIVLRTGQPGQAPEKDVVLDYDVNGYFLKTEITAQKLHSIVIAGLRTYDHIRTLKRHRENVSCDAYGTSMPLENAAEVAAMLSAALDNDEFTLDAQPQLHLRSGQIVGTDVYLRWRDPGEGEMVSADRLPAEECAGLIGRIRDWIMEQACAARASWRDQGLETGRVCISVSAAQLDRGLLTCMQQCLAKWRLNAGDVEIEVPERALMGGERGVREIIARLKGMGIGIAIGGFGSGLASLRELKRIHPDRLKIDKSLIQGAAVDPERSAITRSVIALAHTMGMSVVAEGISTEADLEFLRWEECEAGQGDLIARPVPIEGMAEFLVARSSGLMQA